MNRSPDDSHRSIDPILWRLFSLVLCLSWTPVFAQELITDRPDQTESASVVPGGAFQLETGWTFVRDSYTSAQVYHHQFPGTLLRIGVARRFELRLGFDGWNWQRRQGLWRSGFGDASVGGKITLWDENGARPQLAVLGTVVLPSGEAGFSRQRLEPELRAALAHTLSAKVSLGYNVGVGRTTDAGEDGEPESTTEFSYTASLGIELNPRVGFFLELFGGAPLGSEGPSSHAFDAGFTLLVAPNLQLDVSGGFGISDAAEDWIMGLGLSLRLPR